MARFSVHEWPEGDGLLLNLQTDFLDWLDTRIVAPLLPKAFAPPPARYLNPVFQIDGRDHVMLTQAMAAVPVSAMGREIGNLEDAQDEITRALDMVFQGF